MADISSECPADFVGIRRQRAVNADVRDSQSASAVSLVVTEAWPHKPYTFRALREAFGAMWVRCDVCRRYAPLSIGGLPGSRLSQQDL